MFLANLATTVTCYSRLILKSKSTLIFLAEREGLTASSDTPTDSSGRWSSGHLVTSRQALQNGTKRNP